MLASYASFNKIKEKINGEVKTFSSVRSTKKTCQSKLSPIVRRPAAY